MPAPDESMGDQQFLIESGGHSYSRNIDLSNRVGIAVLDPQCRYLNINRELADFHGFSIDDHCGRTVWEMIPPDVAQTLQPVYNHVITTGISIRNMEFSGAPAGWARSRRWMASYQADSRVGSLWCVRAVVIDITDYYSAQADREACSTCEESLTSTEKSILTLLTVGLTTKEIARQMGISSFTVATHRKHICRKLNVHSTAELVAAAHRIHGPLSA